MTPRIIIALSLPLLICLTVLAADPALPRVSVKDGVFVTPGPDGKPVIFHPRGFNYVRLRSPAQHWHWNFASNYDHDRTEAAMADIASRGYNVVRVFTSAGTGEGSSGGREATELSARYMKNVCDFLGIVRKHKLYVIFAMDGLPGMNKYRDITAAGDPPPFEGRNADFFSDGGIRAKAQYMADFVAAIAAIDKNLLSAVFSYELENETNLNVRAAPFTARSGELTYRGKTYDLSDDKQVQAMADAAMTLRANTCAEAIKKVDPQAMVAMDMFTFAAVGRSGPGKFSTDQTRDRRTPARPLTLTDTKLDYIDIHLYSPSPDGLKRDLASIEWDKLAPAAKKAGKPLLMGEFGSFTSVKSADEAAIILTGHIKRVMNLGFAGWLLWTYDTDEQNFIWNAKMDGGKVMAAMDAVRSYGMEPRPPAPAARDDSAAEKLGLRMAIQAYSFNRFTFFEAVDKTASLGIRYIEAYPGQKLRADAPEAFSHDMGEVARGLALAKLREAGVKLVNYGVVGLGDDEASMRRVFEFAKAMGIETIVSEPATEQLAAIDKLCAEYGINVALHNHPKPSRYWDPKTVVSACEGLSKRVGACADTGHWMRSGITPIDAIKLLDGRIVSLHLKDLNQPGGHDVPWGTGQADLKTVLAALHKQGFKGVLSVEYEYNWDNSVPDIAKCVAWFDKAAAGMIAD